MKWKTLAATKGQVLPWALVVGAVLLIFGLALVSMLGHSVKLSHRVSRGTAATLGTDAVVDKAINTLKQGDNWGAAPSLEFTPIPGFKADKVYTDVPDAQYVVQIDKGNLINPPGDLYYERTISVDLFVTPRGQAAPTVLPTPWVSGGAMPAGAENHRRLQAVVRRGSMTASVVADGSLATNGNFKVFWGDVYNYFQPTAPASITIDMGTNSNKGPGFPAYHTIGYGQTYGCIKSQGTCPAGCASGTGGAAAVYCNVDDTGASACKFYPRDPNMPPKPRIDLELLRQRAQQIYTLNGISSGETGYFYYASPKGTGAGTHSLTMSCAGCAGTGVESNHQYNGNNGEEMDMSEQVKDVLYRMADNLQAQGAPVVPGEWVGEDDLVIFIDTTDKQPLASNLSNSVIGEGNAGDDYAVDFKNFAFRGTCVLLGSFQMSGNSSGPNVTMQPPIPASAWCPPNAVAGNPNINGFLYVGGNINKLVGTPLIYGSVTLEGDFKASGTADIYYRSDFNYNLVKSGTVAITQWKEVKSFPTPIP